MLKIKNSNTQLLSKLKKKGYEVLLLDSPIVSHLIQKLEIDNEKLTFTRVDAAPVAKLIQKKNLLLPNFPTKRKTP